MTTPRMSAVVVAWNAGSTLAACVDSLRASAELAGESLQIVVVDNGSSDGAVDDLRLDTGDVAVRNPFNAGYSVAAAQGMARSAAPWILLANPDLTVEQDFVRALLSAADTAEPAIASLVPEMRFASRPELVNCRGLTVDEIGVPAEIDAGAATVDGATPSIPVLGGSSGCCLLRSEHVRALGGPEPAFFAYLEDVDLALRLSCAGYGTTFVPNAIAFHEGSASTGERSPLKIFLVARNRRLLFRLHGPRSLRETAWRSIADLGHAVYSSLQAPVAPWAGRLEAIRFRRYARFLDRSRAEPGPCIADYDRPKRATVRETLSRKRRIAGRDG